MKELKQERRARKAGNTWDYNYLKPLNRKIYKTKLAGCRSYVNSGALSPPLVTSSPNFLFYYCNVGRIDSYSFFMRSFFILGIPL